MSTSAASQLSPAYPARAPWGTAEALRAWQAEALSAYLDRHPRDFLAVATPGAGKTTFALRLATELIAEGVVQAVIVVTPTEHLKAQWAQAAHRVGLRLDPAGGTGGLAADYDGLAVTYAGVAANPTRLRARTQARRTLVVLDEIHHAGDSLSWGEAVREAFTPATRRIGLTGTPFRSDTTPIPFVHYAPDGDGVRRSVPDYAYGYGRALRDGVVRPVLFLAYGGQMRWRTAMGEEAAATLGEPLTRDAAAAAWRTALDPTGNWVPAVLAAANRRLTEVRRGMPDAGGLVIAGDQRTARGYARALRGICGEPATVVLSDEAGSSERIAQFAAGSSRWMVAVRMVSEGVDVPRLAVGVYATPVATPLFFAQAVGRFVRARRRGETASVFLPSVGVLLGHAADLERERDHALDRPAGGEDWLEQDALVEPERSVDLPGQAETGLTRQTLAAEASFDRVLFDGGDYGVASAVGSEEEQDYLGLPGLLEPDQVRTLLAARQSRQLARRDGAAGSAGTAGVRGLGEPDGAGGDRAPMHVRLAALRRELNGLVGAWHHRTGSSHAAVHAELRRVCGGPPQARASAEQLQQRIDTLRGWALARGAR